MLKLVTIYIPNDSNVHKQRVSCPECPKYTLYNTFDNPQIQVVVPRFCSTCRAKLIDAQSILESPKERKKYHLEQG